MYGGGGRGRSDGSRGGGPRGGRRDRSRSRSPFRGGGGPRRTSTSDRDHNDRMVFITNLSYDVRWVELKSLIREKGGEVKFVEILEDRDGRPKGNAIAEFETRDGAEKCCTNLNRFEFHGRPITAKEIRDPVAFLRKVKEETGCDFLARTGHVSRESERPQRSGTYDLFGLSPEFLRKLNIDPPLCDRVFVANLSYNVGTGRMYEIFGLAGKIVWLDLHMDKEGRSKGVCVVQYSHPIEAVQAISMFHNQKLYDRVLAVKMDKFEKIEKMQEGGLPRGLETIGMGLGADGAPLKDVAAVVSSMTPRTGMSSQMSNMSYGNGVMSGDTRPMATNYASSQPTYGNRMPDQYSDSYAAPSFSRPVIPSSSVLIKNLPHDYTWQIVRDRVQTFGTMEMVDMISPGVARIKFVRVQDAERMRMALEGTSVEGRLINVEYL